VAEGAACRDDGLPLVVQLLVASGVATAGGAAASPGHGQPLPRSRSRPHGLPQDWQRQRRQGQRRVLKASASQQSLM
jgi:hypothetical protein